MNLKFALVLGAFRVSVASLNPNESGTNATLLPQDVKVFYDYLENIENETEATDRRLLTHKSYPERGLSKVCNQNEIDFKLDLTTDDYGSQTRWILKKSRRNIIRRGPLKNTKYDSNSNYHEHVCLLPGNYKLIIFDSGRDGLKSPGKYAAYIDGKKRFSSPASYKSWKKRVHKFKIPPKTTSPPTPKPSSKPASTSTNDIECSTSERKIKVDIETDKYGQDTSWSVNKEGSMLVESGKVYGSHESDSTIFCLRKGSSYDFILYDKVGDGMCCSNGKGSFKISVFHNDSWNEIISGAEFRAKELQYTINLEEPQLSPRDIEWLDSHNSRRKKWHTTYGKSYVPLKWSENLKHDAKVWAEKLLDSCGKGMWHDPQNSDYGENVAGNSGSGSWGTLRSTEDILTRFVEREEDKPYPQNSHLTQVLWRSTKYVGCAEASRPYGNTGTCHTQVCRYSRAGNCNMGSYRKNAETDDWWLEPMLLDDTPCGFECPPDGCS